MCHIHTPTKMSQSQCYGGPKTSEPTWSNNNSHAIPNNLIFKTEINTMHNDDSSSDERLEISASVLHKKMLQRSKSVPHLRADSFSGSEPRETLHDFPDFNDLHVHLHDAHRRPAAILACAAVGEIRPLVTLRRRYYTEGGWGWIVLTVAVIVHVIAHGTQIAAGVLVQHALRRFGRMHEIEAGENNIFKSILK